LDEVKGELSSVDHRVLMNRATEKSIGVLSRKKLEGKRWRERETNRFVAFSFEDDCFSRLHSSFDDEFYFLLLLLNSSSFTFLASAHTQFSHQFTALLCIEELRERVERELTDLDP